MFRNSLIISAFIHLLLLLGLSFIPPSNPVPPKTTVFFELYGDSSGIETGSNGPVVAGLEKQMKQSGAFREKAVKQIKTGEILPTDLTEVPNQPQMAPAVGSKEDAVEPQTLIASEPGGVIEKAPHISVDSQKPGTVGDLDHSDGTGGVKSNNDTCGAGGKDNKDASNGIGLGSRRGFPIFTPQPDYPAQARRNNWEGIIFLELKIGTEGRVQKVTVLKSSGYPLLDQTAEKTLKSWRYRPAFKDGVATVWQTRVRIKFVLED